LFAYPGENGHCSDAFGQCRESVSGRDVYSVTASAFSVKGRTFFAHRLALDFELVSIVNETIESGISQGRVLYGVIPCFDRQLTGDRNPGHFPKNQKTRKPENQKTGKPENRETGKPENRETGKPGNFPVF